MTISFSGLSSGIDTQTIISALVSVEAAQQTLLANQQSSKQQTVNAYNQLVAKLNTLSSAAVTVADTSSWAGTTATSTSTGVSATATGSTAASLTFDVQQVAAAHTLISAGSVGSTSDIVASTGSITVTNSSGTATTLSVGTGSLSEVVNAVNNSNTGLTASAVQVSPGAYRLQVASRTTGAASTFTLAGLDGFTGMNILTTGQDAKIHVGDAATGYDATSSTNTFDSLVSGLSFTVSKVESGVTVSSTVDGTGVAKSVSAMVTAANSVLSYIDSATAWDPTTKTAAPLNGESSVRQLQQNILSMISGSTAPGMSVTSGGRLSFDSTAFTTAFDANPAAVAAQFGSSATFAAAAGATSSSASLSSATSSTQAGSYVVNLSQAATREQWTLPAANAGTISTDTVTIGRGSNSISYTAASGETLATSVANLNTELANAGLGISATSTGTSIVFTAGSYGTSGAFTVSGTDATSTPLTVTQSVAGQNVAGTIDGQVALGSGNVLSLPNGTGGAVGLSLVVNSTTADIAATGGAIGTVRFSPGLAQQIQQLVSSATGTNGTVTSAQSSANAQVQNLQDQIDTWTKRLSDYRAALVSQFTAMETSIATLKNSLSALSGLVGSTSSSSGSSSSLSMTG
jgi:flagellar hook-associated protein 2